MKLMLLLGAALLIAASPARAAVRWFEGYHFGAEVETEGAPACGGRNWEELIFVREGQEYALRVHNPLPVRVGVTVAIDGLNVIDGAHTSPAAGRKWFINPYASLWSRGWQTSLYGMR